jgi:EAL domain-containing protein (putative c-di-GMP-specific phosphodiesterase class I)
MPKERYSEHMFLQAMDVLVQEFTNKFFKIQIDMAVYEIHDIDEPVYQMCDKCDFAIDKIKADYSTRIAYYDENMLEEEMKKNAIINEFDKALMNGEFQMYLQAQTTADGRMVGAEALARWIHPNKGLIPPGEFIPVLEEAGLIYRLDLYIWNQAAKTLAQWKAAGKDNFTISVNISAQDQYYLDIYKVFTELVTTYHIDPINLKLEITESIFITEVEKHLHLINQLQAYGFEVEIDDFGSGYSSLNILKDIAADVIKIDMGFLRETDNAARSRDIIAAVIRLAKSLHMTVITEGVETKEQVEALDAMGCDIYQGYYFAKPIPLKEFEDKYHIYFK